MSYAAWSVIAAEQPTTSKWNILGTNDAAFNDGSGLAFTTNNVVPANALATSAIVLGYAQITSNFSIAFSVSTPTQITGLTATVTIPAGGRKTKITVFGDALTGPVGTAQNAVSIWDGVVNSGTKLAGSDVNSQSGSVIVVPFACMAIVTPSAGSKTYNVGLATSAGSSGNLTVNASGNAPAFILVEAI